MKNLIPLIIAIATLTGCQLNNGFTHSFQTDYDGPVELHESENREADAEDMKSQGFERMGVSGYTADHNDHAGYFAIENGEFIGAKHVYLYKKLLFIPISDDSPRKCDYTVIYWR